MRQLLVCAMFVLLRAPMPRRQPAGSETHARKGFAYEPIASIYRKGWQLRHGGVMLADGCLCPDYWDDGAGAF
jgi:hypothetical protein